MRELKKDRPRVKNNNETCTITMCAKRNDVLGIYSFFGGDTCKFGLVAVRPGGLFDRQTEDGLKNSLSVRPKVFTKLGPERTTPCARLQYSLSRNE